MHSLDAIMLATVEASGFTGAELRSKHASRTPEDTMLRLWRAAFCAVARSHHHTLHEIGHALDRDHSTVWFLSTNAAKGRHTCGWGGKPHPSMAAAARERIRERLIRNSHSFHTAPRQTHNQTHEPIRCPRP